MMRSLTFRIALAAVVLILGLTAAASVIATAPPGEVALAWWLARTSGALCYVALSIAMAMGLLVSIRTDSNARLQRGRVFSAHEAASAAALVTIGVHVLAVVWVVLSGERGVALMAPGAAATAVLATVGTGLTYASRGLLSRLSPSIWRLMHRSVFVAYLLAVTHAGLAAPGLIESHVRWAYLLLGATLAGAVLTRALLARGTAHAAGATQADTLSSLLEREVSVARLRGEDVVLVLVGMPLADPAITRLEADAALADALRACFGRRTHSAPTVGGGVGMVVRGGGVGETSATAIERVAEKLRAAVPEIFCGVAVYPRDAWDAQGLHRAGAIALQSARIRALGTA